MMARITRGIVAGLLARGPARGTWAHQISGLIAAVVLGLVLYWSRSHR